MAAELEFDLNHMRQAETHAPALARGGARLLRNMGYGVLGEFLLSSGRRVDVFGLNRKGAVVIVEIKLSAADFRADAKWPDYLAFCDHFYFAVPERFPRRLVPAETGLLIADRFGADVIRRAPARRMANGLRQNETRRFALFAANRLRQVEDPDF